MISEKEYDKLIKRLEFFDTMRNNLLTFSFTAVLAILVYVISHSTNNYQGLLDDFEKKWEIYNKKVVIK